MKPKTSLLTLISLFFQFSSQSSLDLSQTALNSTTVFEVFVPESVASCISAKTSSLRAKKPSLTAAASSQIVAEIYENAEILCSENFESNVASSFDEIVTDLRGQQPIDEEIRFFERCLKFILLRRNASGPLVDSFDRSLLKSLANSAECDEVERKIGANEVGDRECIEKAPLANANLKVNLLSIAHYAREIVEAERKSFVEETRSQLEFHMNCMIEKANRNAGV